MTRGDAQRTGAQSFQLAHDQAYLELCIERARGVYLTWVEQMLDILEEELDGTPGTLNDIGCNLGQFWKGLKRRDLPLDYRGFDIEPIYLREAEKVFPELAGRLHELDVLAAPPPPADVTVTSATLEHLPALQPALDRLLESTSSVILLRTFLGGEALSDTHHKPGAAVGYPMNQYTFDETFEALERAGFEARAVKDRHTGSEPKAISPTVTRSQWVVVGKRPA